MSATAPASQRPLTELVLPKIPLIGVIQNIAYSIIGSQWAVGIVSAIYVLVTQATYFGHSFRGTWNNLNTIWHVRAVPCIGGWMFAHWDVFRHVFLRDAPESVLAYAFITMIVVKWKNLKDQTPLTDRVLVALHMPSRYQGRYTRRDGQPRNPGTTPLQMLFLPVSMLAAAIPGEAAASAVVFGGMALAHRYGVLDYGWNNPAASWVPIVIGLAGGHFAGHKPAVKAGDDVQRFFLNKRLSVAYTAETILQRFRDGDVTLDKARDEVTGLRGTKPSVLYPPFYRLAYDTLLAARAEVRRYGRASSLTFAAALFLGIVLGGYGLYVRKIGVPVGHFWMP